MGDRRFEDLMAGMLDDELTPEEWVELVQLVREAPERQRQLQAHLETAEWIAQAENELRDSPRFVAATLSRTEQDPFVAGVKARLDETASMPRRPWRRRLTAASVAVAALFVGLAFWLTWFKQPLVRITELNGSVQWMGDGGQLETDLQQGQPLGGGTLESLSVDSWAVLVYGDGTTITVSGRSKLTVVDGPQKEVRLDHGRISASVPPQPTKKPMLIHTPTADLEILGTQLNVETDVSMTLVNVNVGRVRVTRLVDGSIVEVPADYQAVATLDRHTELRASQRPEHARVWRSEFPRDVQYGQWQPGPGGGGELRAASLLLTCWRPKPLLIYVATANVAGKNSPPLLLNANGRFRVRGSLDSPAEVVFGLTMHNPRGGFAGKYVASKKFEAARGKDEPFDWELPVRTFKPLEGTFPASPAGLELVDCWCLTVRENHGLTVRSIDLQCKEETINHEDK